MGVEMILKGTADKLRGKCVYILSLARFLVTYIRIYEEIDRWNSNIHCVSVTPNDPAYRYKYHAVNSAKSVPRSFRIQQFLAIATYRERQ
jgi:hypothetical protein